MRAITKKHLQQQPYPKTLKAMQDFTAKRGFNTPDEIWLVEHPPVFTLGRNAKISNLINSNNIELVQSDRGGDITYHGPGQLMVYFLFDLKRAKIGIKKFVRQIENLGQNLLQQFGIESFLLKNKPGIYTDKGKIASIGLTVKHGCTYHGLALNIDMDLTPFSYINPCGEANCQIAQMKDFCEGITIKRVLNVFDCFVETSDSGASNRNSK